MPGSAELTPVYPKSRIAVFGLGYVGAVTAACLADLGHEVAGVDRDQLKVDAILSGRAPFYEPQLEELIRRNAAAGRLSATVSAEEAVERTEIALLCVGTPSEPNGNLSVDQLRRAAAEIAGALGRRPKPYLATVRSTVFPGTCEEVVQPAFEGLPVGVVCNPEFLREGAAVEDFMQPPLIVIGGSDRQAVDRVAGIYGALGVAPRLVSLRTAEMIKYACNAFHAVKISFANEIGALASKLGAPPDEVMDTLCQDHKLNASAAYLKPGFAFGGSCLPKDLRALAYRASRLDLKLPLLESTMPSNGQHLARAIQRVMDLPAGRIGVFGLSFKENTDDLRESPVIGLLEHLIGKGREVRVFDPQIRLDGIYGSNRQFVLTAIPHIGRLMTGSLGELLGWAEYLVVTQRPEAGLAAQILGSGLPVVELAGPMVR